MQAIFHKDFKAAPFWWEDYKPQAVPEIELPSEVHVAIIGAGYTGLSAALELKSHCATHVASTAPKICTAMNGKTEAGDIPAKLSLKLRAMVTAGFAKLVDAVNQ